ATEVYPEGLLFYILGVQLANAGRLADAEQAFLKAAEGPSFVPVRRVALYGAVFCEWQLAGSGSGDDGMLRGQAPESARKPGSPGGLQVHEARLVARLANDAGATDLARWVIGEWGRQAPDDPLLPRMRMVAEYNAGAFGPAIKAADRVLARDPRDA